MSVGTVVLLVVIGAAVIGSGILYVRVQKAKKAVDIRMAAQRRADEEARRQRIIEQRTRPARTISSGTPVSYSGSTVRPVASKKPSAPKPRKTGSSDDTTYGYVAPDSSWDYSSGSYDSGSSYSSGSSSSSYDSGSSSSSDSGSSGGCD